MGGKFRKRVERLLDACNNTSFEELSSLLKRAGFEVRQPEGGSSHYTFFFTHPRLPDPISVGVVRAKPVKAVYVKRAYQAIMEVLELEGVD